MAEETYSDYQGHQVVFDFIVHKKTGTLIFQPEGRKLFFQAGNLVFASSDNSKEHFSEILVDMGVISAEQLAVVRDGLQKGESLGKKLKASGLADSGQLVQSLKQQITSIVDAVFESETGAYEVQEGDLPAKVPTLKIQVLALIIRTINNLKSRVFLKDLPFDNTINPASDFDGKLPGFEFPSSYVAFINYIRSQPAFRAAEVSDHFGWNESLTQGIFYVMYHLGLIEFQEPEPEEDLMPFPDDLEPAGPDVFDEAMSGAAASFQDDPLQMSGDNANDFNYEDDDDDVTIVDPAAEMAAMDDEDELSLTEEPTEALELGEPALKMVEPALDEPDFGEVPTEPGPADEPELQFEEDPLTMDEPEEDALQLEPEPLAFEEEAPLEPEPLAFEEEAPLEPEPLSFGEEVPMDEEPLSFEEEAPTEPEPLSFEQDEPEDEAPLTFGEELPADEEPLSFEEAATEPEEVPLSFEEQDNLQFDTEPESLEDTDDQMSAAFEEAAQAEEEPMSFAADDFQLDDEDDQPIAFVEEEPAPAEAEESYADSLHNAMQEPLADTFDGFQEEVEQTIADRSDDSFNTEPDAQPLISEPESEPATDLDFFADDAPPAIREPDIEPEEAAPGLATSVWEDEAENEPSGFDTQPGQPSPVADFESYEDSGSYETLRGDSGSFETVGDAETQPSLKIPEPVSMSEGQVILPEHRDDALPIGSHSSSKRLLLVVFSVVVILACLGWFYTQYVDPSLLDGLTKTADAETSQPAESEPVAADDATPAHDAASMETDGSVAADTSTADDATTDTTPEPEPVSNEPVVDNTPPPARTTPEPRPPTTRTTPARTTTSAAMISEADVPGLSDDDVARFRDEGKGYSIAVMTACQADTVMRFVNQYGADGDVYVLPTTFQGKACYTVTWGNFATYREAAAQLNNLPDAFKGLGSPWVKNFKNL